MKIKKPASRRRKIIQWIGWVLLVQFILINISAALYADKITHMYAAASKTDKTGKENILQKTWRIFSGSKVYKTIETDAPTVPYVTVNLQSGTTRLEAWYIKTETPAKGSVILFHGYGGDKAFVLDQANEFRYWGYNVLVADARGHGNSSGNYTTIGYKEAADVKTAYDYLVAQGEKHIILWGNSMGAVQIIKAIADYEIKPAAIILEMPFASLRSFLKRRAATFGFPAEPFALLTTFWIGVERGMNGFAFDNIKCAKKITCPVLFQCGDRDHLIPMKDSKALYEAMPAKEKKMVVYENTDHEPLLKKDTNKWRLEVEEFLSNLKIW